MTIPCLAITSEPTRERWNRGWNTMLPEDTPSPAAQRTAQVVWRTPHTLSGDEGGREGGGGPVPPQPSIHGSIPGVPAAFTSCSNGLVAGGSPAAGDWQLCRGQHPAPDKNPGLPPSRALAVLLHLVPIFANLPNLSAPREESKHSWHPPSGLLAHAPKTLQESRGAVELYSRKHRSTHAKRDSPLFEVRVAYTL